MSSPAADREFFPDPWSASKDNNDCGNRRSPAGTSGEANTTFGDGVGGVRFLYPLLGEELALRVPLEVQTLSFHDEKKLTREYLEVDVRGTMKWRIDDIRRFYLLVSRELRATREHGDRVRDYGIVIEDVSLQEVRMPDEIVRECVAACRSAYLPSQARNQASMEREKLRAETDLLGADNVAAQRMVEAAPAYTLPDFLTQIVAEKRRGDGSINGQLWAAQQAKAIAGHGKLQN